MLASPSRHDWVAAGVPGLLSVVIPAHNEAENLRAVVPTLLRAVQEAGIDHEILVVNDNSTDGTRDVLVELAGRALPACASSTMHRRTDLGWRCAQALRNFAAMPSPS